MIEQREYVQSRSKVLLLLFGCLIFVVAGAVTLPSSAPRDQTGLILGMIFFGLGLPISVCLLLRPQRLTLNAEGFVVSGGLKRKSTAVRWQATEPFFVYQLPRGGKAIAFNYRPGFEPNSLLSKVSHRLGADGSLPRMWPGAVPQMVDELNTYRAKALELNKAGT